MVQLACTILNNRFQCYIYSFFYYSLNWKLYHGLAFVLKQTVVYCIHWCAIRHLKYSQVTGFTQSDWLNVIMISNNYSNIIVAKSPT